MAEHYSIRFKREGETVQTKKNLAKGYIDEKNTAKAFGRDLDMKPKYAKEIGRKLRGMMLEDAMEYLEQVQELREPVPVRSHTTGAGHRRGKKGPGKYPVKAARALGKLLVEVEANAQVKELMTDSLMIVHYSSYKGRIYRKNMPRARGRSTPWFNYTTNVEIVVMDMTSTEEEA